MPFPRFNPIQDKALVTIPQINFLDFDACFYNILISFASLRLFVFA